MEIKSRFNDLDDQKIIKAAFFGDDEILSNAISQKQVFIIEGSGGTTPLWWAMQGRQINSVELLLKAGANPNIQTDDGFNIMELSASIENTEYLKVCLSNGGDPNLISSKTGFTPIFTALLTKNIENVKMLIAAGANVNYQNRYKDTPLLQAGLRGSYEGAYLLLEHGANRNVRATGGYDFKDILLNEKLRTTPDEDEWRTRIIEKFDF